MLDRVESKNKSKVTYHIDRGLASRIHNWSFTENQTKSRFVSNALEYYMAYLTAQIQARRRDVLEGHHEGQGGNL